MAILALPAQRTLWLDLARGGAICAMIVYHGAFDLSFFGLVDWNVAFDPAWRTFAAAIASTFLFLVGISLVAAHKGGVRWRAFGKRFLVVGGCALLVTAATVAAMPAPIYFGILHAIAAFSVLALPFLKMPWWVSAVAALVVFAAPAVATSNLFAHPAFYPLGLSPVRPFTFDYEPIFPWLGATLLGVAFALKLPQAIARPSGPVDTGLAVRVIAAAGRNSLAIYLLHQPILFGFLLVFLWWTSGPIVIGAAG
ncbi:MAG: heparan-alpha-glucosaminide N-acetyltransferase [Pseudomonadota bacterium]